jgi:hypothetical protein
MKNSTYFRIHTNDIAYLTQRPRGLFATIGKLVDQDIMDSDEVEEYWKQRKWFEANLPVPPFYEDGNSIKAITWYKKTPEGLDMFKRMDFYFKMAKKYSLELFMTETESLPGTLVYEDEFQIGITDSGHDGTGFKTKRYEIQDFLH